MSMEKMCDVAVIGGGAAGMLAAVILARRGASVLLLERMSRVGKKLLATGNGRCNLTNARMDFSRFHGGGGEAFVRGVIDRFPVAETLAFFEQLGVLTREEDAGRIFPVTDQASCVLDVLRYEMERLGVKVLCDTNISRVDRRKSGFACVTPEGKEFLARKVFAATGGKSSPNLGSNGGGFKIAAGLGHAIVPPWPALVQINSAEPFLKQLDGLRVEAEISVLVDGAAACRSRGEVLFTDYGLSGLAALEVSRFVGGCFREGEPRRHQVLAALDLFPGLTADALERLIINRFSESPEKPLDFALVGLLHKRLIPVVLKSAGFSEFKAPCGTAPLRDAARLTAFLKDWRMALSGTQSWMHSQVTAGGVDTREANPATLESLRVPGVYFLGEVLDVDADSGGFNLQWAWSSGYVAADAAAQSLGL